MIPIGKRQTQEDEQDVRACYAVKDDVLRGAPQGRICCWHVVHELGLNRRIR